MNDKNGSDTNYSVSTWNGLQRPGNLKTKLPMKYSLINDIYIYIYI